jgi:hypothetical protein
VIEKVSSGVVIHPFDNPQDAIWLTGFGIIYFLFAMFARLDSNEKINWKNFRPTNSNIIVAPAGPRRCMKRLDGSRRFFGL